MSKIFDKDTRACPVDDQKSIIDQYETKTDSKNTGDGAIKNLSRRNASDQADDNLLNSEKNHLSHVSMDTLTNDFSIGQATKFIRIIELPLIIAFTCIAPIIARLYDRGFIFGFAVVETLSVLASAAIISWYVLNRLKEYAETQHLSYVLPINLAIFGAFLALVALTRTPYSGMMFTVGTLSAVIASFGFAVYSRKFIRPHIVVSVGRANEIIIGGQFKYSPSLRDLEGLIDSGRRDWAIVTDLHYPHSGEWERLFAKASLASIPVYHYKQIAETQTGQVRISHLSENELGSLIPNVSYMSMKRAIDVCVSILIIPILVPIFALISIVIILDSPGGAFFIQERVGFRGRPFKMIKFRTMRKRGQLLEGVARREDAMTKQDDDRITRVGGFLRKTRIDELPQVLNVLSGQMSFIGPRPEANSLSEWYESELPFYSYRHIVRPGITGWAQVNQGHVTDVQEIVAKLRFDFYYIKNISLWLDVLVVLKTFRVIVTGTGAK